MKKYENVCLIAGSDMVIEENTIWLSLYGKNGFCEIDKSTKKCKKIIRFENENMSERHLYETLLKVGNKIVMAPHSASRIALYNIEDDNIEYINLKPIKDDYKENYYSEEKFWNAFAYENYVFLLGYSYPAIIRINIETSEVLYITDWLEKIGKYKEKGKRNGYFTDGYVLEKDRVFLPFGRYNAILELNLNTLKNSILELNCSLSGIGGITSDGNNIWMVGRGDNDRIVVCWNRENNRIIEINILSESDKENIFYAPKYISGKVYFIPLGGGHVFEIDSITREIKLCREFEKVFYIQGKRYSDYTIITKPYFIDNKIYFITGHDFMWHEYNMDTHQMESYYITIPEELGFVEDYFDDLLFGTIYRKEVIKELQMPLSVYIQKINNNNKNFSQEKSYGQLIYKNCLQDI